MPSWVEFIHDETFVSLSYPENAYFIYEYEINTYDRSLKIWEIENLT